MAKVAAAGGVTVFAHPYARLRGPWSASRRSAKMAAAGLAGIEVDHPDHAPAGPRGSCAGWPRELDLVVTGSSDYHGTRKEQGLGAETTDRRAARAAAVRGHRARGRH